MLEALGTMADAAEGLISGLEARDDGSLRREALQVLVAAEQEHQDAAAALWTLVGPWLASGPPTTAATSTSTSTSTTTSTTTTMPLTTTTLVTTTTRVTVTTQACHPSYQPCLPIVSDIDCAGGSGNGPYYTSGPIRVIGPDVYDLDGDGDGWGCE